MQDTTADLFLSVSIVFALFGIAYYFLITRYKERIAIIEKNLPGDFFNDNRNYLPFVLLLGIVAVGISLGMLVGAFLNALQIDGFENVMLPFALCFFLGLSLIAGYFILKAIESKR
jgi:hypothetical protein